MIIVIFFRVMTNNWWHCDPFCALEMMTPFVGGVQGRAANEKLKPSQVRYREKDKNRALVHSISVETRLNSVKMSMGPHKHHGRTG